MPELPEVERIARTIAPRVVDREVVAARLRRRDICRSVRGGRAVKAGARELLQGTTIVSVHRHGKHLALLGADGRALAVHLGMSGSLTWRSAPPTAKHVHAVWQLAGPKGEAAGWMVFRDPRRFGGLWTFESMAALEESRWAGLGPDALTIKPAHLREALAGSTRAIKAALLDQNVLAGVGNIYADEALFRAGIRPQAPAGRLTTSQVARLASAIRAVLRAAIGAGGSTLRDFTDAESLPGGYQHRHAVYGRAGRPCPKCGRPLTGTRIAQRATVFCRACQPR